MKKLIKTKTKNFVILYLLIDLICAGAGMGVPVFNILLGFPLGYYLTRRISLSENHAPSLHKKILKFSVLTSAFTFLLMLVVWGAAASIFLNSTADFKNFGHPFILYDPKISFIGWLILIIFISPFLQLLTTIFASFITLLYYEK